MLGEIRCANSTLSECFRHVAGRICEPFGAFLENMAEHMEEFRGDTVQEIFTQHVEQDLRDTALATEDLEQLKRLGEQLGYLDAQMQLNAPRFTRTSWRIPIKGRRRLLRGKQSSAVIWG